MNNAVIKSRRKFIKKFTVFPKTIHIWTADLSKQSMQVQALNSLLSADECLRANHYKFEKDKKYFITARGILRKIISNYLSIKPEKIKFHYNPCGKPYIKNQDQTDTLHFNLSHSSDLALYIFSRDSQVGIDIERINFIDDLENIARQFFSPQEYLKLKSIPASQKLNSFYKCWTRKEAFIKAIGDGLSYPLDQFDVNLDPNESPALLCIQGDSEVASKWSLHSFMPAPNYEAAFIFEGRNKKIKFLQFQ